MSTTAVRHLVLAAALAAAGPATADEALVRYYECNHCHVAGEAQRAPTYADIAARYATVANARERLFAVVKRGGKGNWTEVSRGAPMPPYYADMSDEDIDRVVDWILAQ